MVITGAGAGVGRATAVRFAQDGARVALIARGEQALQGAREAVETAGGTALAIPVDVSDPESVERAADQIERDLGPIDVWVNDAMATIFAFFGDIEPDEFRRSTDVTYHGAVWGTRAALRRMRPRDRGVIVQVGSAIAYQGIPLQSPYSGAKHALKGFFDSVRIELRHQGSGVHVTMVQLPGLNTPQFVHGRSKLPEQPMPVPPIFQPEVAAEAIYWAAGHRRREVFVGGSTLKTVLGAKLAPWVSERYLARTGVKGQQADEKRELADSEGNLMSPVDEDPGAHGIFDESARARSHQLWFTKHRLSLLGAGAGIAAATAGVLSRARR